MTAPASIAHYKITAKIGEGGMGEVYRATDTKLGREVAIKVLPDFLAKDPDRLARFTREAQVLASLNHPNIAAIYGVEDRALVLELAEGPTLAERLQQGPIPLDEALPMARQIAEGMEYAHEHGVVHRDLKPANVKVREDGTVKVLDFGLARALLQDSAGSSADAMNSPTLTARATQMGVIMGTAAYMAPEQAKGRTVDRRADIWAFGVVLYEMLAGKRGYQAEDVSETLAAVLTREVDWSSLPATTPPRLVRLLHDCLARDPRQRLRDIGEARRVLDQLISGAPDSGSVTSSANIAAPASARRAWLPWAVAAVAVLASLAMAVAYFRRSADRPPEMRLQIATQERVPLVMLSPDGRLIAYVEEAEKSKALRMWVRALASETAKPLPGTEGNLGGCWSPDGKSLAFLAAQKLKRIEVETGTVQTLADAPTPRGCAWAPDGTILFAPAGNAGLSRIPAAGGQPQAVTHLAGPQERSHRYPQFLPDGRHFLFWIIGPQETAGVYAGSLDSTESKRILQADGAATFVPPNHLLFVRESVLYAQRFDPGHLKLSGEPYPVASGVSSSLTGFPRATASDTGLIAFRPDESIPRQFTWLDRSGKPVGTISEPMPDMITAELSPDGRTLAVYTVQGEVGASGVSLMDVTRGTLTRLTTAQASSPRWSPDGSKIAFSSTGGTGFLDLYWKTVGGGPEELLYASPEAKNLSDWSLDGKYVLYSPQTKATARDVWALPVTGPLTGQDRKPFAVAQTPAEERGARFSPDGKWVAYESDESGRFEIYARPFPGPGPAVRVSTGGGHLAFWRRDGKELYYVNDDQLMAVSIKESAASLDVGLPALLFKAVPRGAFIPQTDGQRFLYLLPQGEVSVPPITVILNWAGQDK